MDYNTLKNKALKLYYLDNGFKITKKARSIPLDDNGFTVTKPFYHSKSLEIYKDINKELTALQLLERNFINEPRIDHYPFPKVLAYDCRTITMTYCGINAVYNAELINTQQNIKPNNLYNTVECIINNLKNNRIVYGDWKADNVCINESGNVSLIDFGCYKFRTEKQTSTSYAKPDLAQLEKDLYNYIGCKSSDNLLLEAIKQPDDRWGWKWKTLTFKHNPWSILYLF